MLNDTTTDRLAAGETAAEARVSLPPTPQSPETPLRSRQPQSHSDCQPGGSLTLARLRYLILLERGHMAIKCQDRPLGMIGLRGANEALDGLLRAIYREVA